MRKRFFAFELEEGRILDALEARLAHEKKLGSRVGVSSIVRDALYFYFFPDEYSKERPIFSEKTDALRELVNASKGE